MKYSDITEIKKWAVYIYIKLCKTAPVWPTERKVLQCQSLLVNTVRFYA